MSSTDNALSTAERASEVALDYPAINRAMAILRKRLSIDDKNPLDMVHRNAESVASVHSNSTLLATTDTISSEQQATSEAHELCNDNASWCIQKLDEPPNISPLNEGIVVIAEGVVGSPPTTTGGLIARTSIGLAAKVDEFMAKKPMACERIIKRVKNLE